MRTSHRPSTGGAKPVPTGFDATPFVGLTRRLLELASLMAPESRSLRTEEFRGQIEQYCNELASATEPRHIVSVSETAVRQCESFFDRAQTYAVERESEFRELIEMLRTALANFASDSQEFHGQLLRTSEELTRLQDLDDIRTLKSRLSDEVNQLKQAVERRQKRAQEHESSLTEKIDVLETKLERTKRQATLDALTGVANRGCFDETLAYWIRERDARQGTFALAMIDLDDFKMINDEHGHVVGDRVLRCAADALTSNIREDDFVARYGGEEFAVLMNDANLRTAQKRLTQIVDEIGASRYKYTQFGENHWIRFTVSAGITEFSRGDTRESIVTRADQALYVAKKRGKNRVEMKKKRRLSLLS